MRLDEFTESTGDPGFDRMMGNITGRTDPTVDLGNRQTEPDRKTRELTHKIFLALRDYDDPETYNKFVDFMRRTLDPNIGSID